jgi:hypothetical protein
VMACLTVNPDDIDVPERPVHASMVAE